MNVEQETPRFATVAVVGRPNVGKSTLMNRLLGVKLSITASKPQTTRHRILGVASHRSAQFALIDTPGIHVAQGRALNRSLNRAARAAVDDAQVLLWVLDVVRIDDEDRAVGALLKGCSQPLVIALNKVDKLDDKSRLLPILTSLQNDYQPKVIVPLSALKDRDGKRLLDALLPFAPFGEHRYEADELTDRSERFLAAERVREQIVRLLRDELPYSTSVEIESFAREGALLRLGAVIWVERDGQKAIVIGRGGEQLKKIGTAARKSLEQFFDCKVHLETWVRVRDNWSDDDRALKQLGHDD